MVEKGIRDGICHAVYWYVKCAKPELFESSFFCGGHFDALPYPANFKKN